MLGGETSKTIPKSVPTDRPCDEAIERRFFKHSCSSIVCFWSNRPLDEEETERHKKSPPKIGGRSIAIVLLNSK